MTNWVTAWASRSTSITCGGIRRSSAAIARAGTRILTYHVCDWLVPTADLVADRGMMGDGIIDLRGIRAMVEAAGYAGHCDVEIFSARNWWTRDPAEVLQVCVERHRSAV